MPYRERKVRALIAMLLVMLPANLLQAQAARPAPPLQDRAIKYVKRGAPVRRVSAGVRGHSEVGLDRQVVALLAPHDHVAWTASERPDLYWRFAGRSEQIARAMLIMTRGTQADTLQLPRPEPGLQRIALDESALHLRRGVDYRWVIVVRYTDTDLPDASDEAWLRVVAGSAPAPTTAADPVAQAQTAASMGLWYDAFNTLSSEYAHDPADEKLVSLWNTFLSGTVPGLTPPPMRVGRARR
jgi:Domain of Unknown Function (DUF928)